MKYFLNDTHEWQYFTLLNQAQCCFGDVERKSMFYIFSSNVELYTKVGYFYDFQNNVIKRDGFKKIDVATSYKALIRLAFNLYNSNNKADVSETFEYLDSNNTTVAINAIKIRFAGLVVSEE